MPLSGWRAAYTGDVLGWHDRARKHFDAYAASQVTHKPQVKQHPAQDPEMNLARSIKEWVHRSIVTDTFVGTQTAMIRCITTT
jgi:hypothetical protein